MLNKEYPAPAPIARNLVIALMFGVFISFFLLFFEPFDISVATGKNTVGSLIFFGFISTIVLVLFLYILPWIFPSLFSDEHWKVKHQIIFCFMILLVIATCNGLYTNYLHSLRFNWNNYWWIIKNTVILGCIPFSFLILIDYQRRHIAHTKNAEAIRPKPFEGDQTSEVRAKDWSISTDLKHEIFTLHEDTFSHAVAVGNYVDVYCTEKEFLKSKTYRMTLASFENQLDAKYLVRCHRSYLVNLSKVKHISGNAQGLKLSLSDKETIIPVSRKYIPVIQQFFSEAH